MIEAWRKYVKFLLNGVETLYNDDPERSLMNYLNSIEFQSYSLPCCNGNGACGACTLLLDDNPVLPCNISMGEVMHKSIITADAWEQKIQEVFSSMLDKAGPPHCKFCIPDMVMTARMFLKECQDPTFEQALRAITKHLCTCVGRPRLAKALLNTAEILDAHAHGAVETSQGYSIGNR